MNAEKNNTFINVQSDIYNLIVNSQQINRSKSRLPLMSIGARGKAVHLLSAAMMLKKRKRPERTATLIQLPVSLQQKEKVQQRQQVQTNSQKMAPQMNQRQA
jgi:hypothetical protein